MSMRKSEKQLYDELQAAHKLVEVGGLYAHYKDRSHTYRVRDLSMAEDKESKEEVPWITYNAQYGYRVRYSRPLAEWLEPAEWKGETVIRYERIESLQPHPGKDHPE